MPTRTAHQIVELITEKRKVRPVELATALQISPQALHRHLRRLVEEGVLQARGSAPKTFYMLGGVPDLEECFEWVSAPKAGVLAGGEFLNETRDMLTARLPRLRRFTSEGLDATKVLPLVIACAGELGNNAFDHNLGNWRDVPGCWLQAQTVGKQLWLCVADRGQGVLRSLSRTLPQLADDQAALEAAFELQISGRASEKRGNGLKFVRATIEADPRRGLGASSGKGFVSFGAEGNRCAALLRKHFRRVDGTVCLTVWELT